jgi:apolipoprotein N-acyltransferase
MIQKKYLPLILFILGFGIFIFTRLSKLVPTIPIAILIAFVFILRFTRTQPTKRGIWLTLLGFILSINIGLWGLFDMGGGISSLLFNLIRSSLLAVLYFLPFMTDRLIYPKFKNKGLLSTLIFPVITTALFFLLTIEGPFEGAVQPGKFVFGSIAFKQLLSLFGVWGFVFVTSWFASAINYLWEKKLDWKKTKKLVLIFSSIVLMILLFGAIKTSYLMTPEADTVKVAAIIIIPEGGEAIPMEKVFTDKLTSPFEKRLSKIENLIKTAASNDAKIISFQEFAIIINEEDHDKLREEFRRISQKNNIYLSISYAYFAKEGKGENKHLLIDNNGEILLDYTKKYLLGIGDIGETRVFRKGPEIIQSADTPYGKIGLSICREMEMAKYMKQAGKAGVDIMFSSAYEWPKSWVPNNLHRAIENGFSLVRPAYNGITHAQDYNGNILNQMDFEETDTGIMYADVPTKGVKTLYPRVGALIGWLSVLGLLILVVFAIKNRKKK